MAEYYVYSGATGAADGSSWADAFTTLGAAFSGKAAGDVFYVADDHAESQASYLVLASPGTEASPCEILCVLRSGGSVPPVAADLRTTATITTTGNNGIAIAGCSYFYGIQFIVGSGSIQSLDFQLTFSNSVVINYYLDSCVIKFLATGSGSHVSAVANNLNNRASSVIFNNTNLSFANVGQQLRFGGALFIWKNTTTPFTDTIPTTAIALNNSATKASRIFMSGLDFNSHGSGKTLFNISGATGHDIILENCKLNAAGAITTGTQAGFGAQEFRLINCDSGDTNYRYEKTDGGGTVTSETTIVRTGGATDGTTPISRKMVSVSRTKFYAPLTFDIMFWNETTGSALTLGIETVSDNVTFTDKELWLEVQALTTSGFPLSTFTNDRAATILTTGTSQPTSSETWTTTGLTTPVKQKIEATVTPQEKGWIRCTVNLAKPSSTVYICPKVTGTGVTSSRQWQARDAYMIEGGSGGGVRQVNIRGGADQ